MVEAGTISLKDALWVLFAAGITGHDGDEHFIPAAIIKRNEDKKDEKNSSHSYPYSEILEQLDPRITSDNKIVIFERLSADQALALAQNLGTDARNVTIGCALALTGSFIAGATTGLLTGCLAMAFFNR
ncbi:MAG: hypothetical protein ACOYK9_05005 [Chlamydiia bacterium]